MTDAATKRQADIEQVFVKQDEDWRKLLENLAVGEECKLGDGWKWTRPSEGQYRERGITHDAPIMLVRTDAYKYCIRTELKKGDKVVVWRSN